MRSEVRLAPHFQNSLIGLTDCKNSFVVARSKPIPVLVSYFHFHTPCFDFGPFLGMMSNEEKKTYQLLDFQMQNFMLNLLEKKMFKNNHYFRSLLDLENRLCVLVQFEIFEQIWRTVKDSLKRFENYRCFAFNLSTYYYM